MSRGLKILLGLAVALAFAMVLLVWRWYLPTRSAVDIGATMLAKQVCSCVYVANRSVADCRADQFASTDPIALEVLRDPDRVRAWVTGFGERTAIHREGFGCTLE